MRHCNNSLLCIYQQKAGLMRHSVVELQHHIENKHTNTHRYSQWRNKGQRMRKHTLLRKWLNHCLNIIIPILKRAVNFNNCNAYKSKEICNALKICTARSYFLFMPALYFNIHNRLTRTDKRLTKALEANWHTGLSVEIRAA